MLQQEQKTEWQPSLTRAVKLELTKDQIALLVDYALRNGYQPKFKHGRMDTTEQNLAAKYAILQRLGFS